MYCNRRTLPVASLRPLHWNWLRPPPTLSFRSRQLCLADSTCKHRENTPNEGLVRIRHKCLSQVYAIPEMKLHGLVISKTELYCSLSQFPHSYICEHFIYSQDRSAYFTAARYAPGNIWIGHRYMNTVNLIFGTVKKTKRRLLGGGGGVKAD